MQEDVCCIHSSNDLVSLLAMYCVCYMYIHLNDANHKGKRLLNLCLYITSFGIVNQYVLLASLTGPFLPSNFIRFQILPIIVIFCIIWKKSGHNKQHEIKFIFVFYLFI